MSHLVRHMKRWFCAATATIATIAIVCAGAASSQLEPVFPGPWQPIPYLTAEHREAGVQIGGEGAQWPGDIAIDRTDGRLILFVTDVGGLWRSTNQGQTWEPCNVGFIPRGASAVQIDPFNPDRVVAVGSNSMATGWNGLYLSEDGAASWRPVQTEKICGIRDRRKSLAYDPTSYDEAAGMTRTVYWSRTNEVRLRPSGNPDRNPGLYRSDDGGVTWQRLPESADIAGHSHLAVHPVTGRVYAANAEGVFVSDDRGVTFTQVFDQPVGSIDVHPDRPDRAVIVASDTKLFASDDAGETWTKIDAIGLDEPLRGWDGKLATSKRENVQFQGLRSSPADPDRLAMRSMADDWQWRRHVSHDGGRTWKTSRIDADLAFFPQNVRQATFAWHPTDPDRVWSYGGDWITASNDGGLTYQWASEGQTAVCVGGRFNFNPHYPGLMFLASQDYNGAVTRDGGYTWDYTNVSGLSWGGFTYGAMAITPEVLATGRAESWHARNQLNVSTDGGQTWTEHADLYWDKNPKSPDYGFYIGLVHPIDPDIAFVARLRTDDGGKTWETMTDVSGVFASDASGRLYGVKRGGDAPTRIVVSADGGETWEVIAEIGDKPVGDMGVRPDGTELYVATGRLYAIDPTLHDAGEEALRLLGTPPSSTGRHRVMGVDVDHRNQDIIYVGQHHNVHAADAGVLRSRDRGETWENLTVTQPLDGTIVDGGREPMNLRVDPATGDVWVVTSCYGVWRYIPSRDPRY
ncbi:MAG: hypothetical protein AAF823_05945 [Planctomycetota bacterium]